MTIKMSFLLEINSDEAKDIKSVFCGQFNETFPVLCKCPNCQEMMFPVFTVSNQLLEKTGFENHLGCDHLTIDVCPSCSHSLKNYYTKMENGKRVAYLGYCDGEGAVNFIDRPYGSRSVKLVSIDKQMWDDSEFIEKYLDRRFLNGVIHQLGGEKLKTEVVPLTECLCCNGKVEYVATVDYDDLNVPIYENGEPRALIIGDMQSINVFVCKECSALNYGITE